MICDYRDCRRPGLFWPMVLAAGICLLGAGCSSMPDSRQGAIDPAPWLSSGLGSKTETGAFKKKVEADSFPTAAEAGA